MALEMTNPKPHTLSEYARRQAVDAFKNEKGLSPDMSERQIRESYDYGGDEMMDAWILCWQLATRAAYERAAQEIETHAVFHGDQYGGYASPSLDAEVLAAHLRRFSKGDQP